MTITEIEALVSGQCKWIGREDVHVYCRHPMAETMMPWGRPGWTREPGAARYCIVCPEAGLDYGTWITAEQAAVIVDRIVAGVVPAAA